MSVMEFGKVVSRHRDYFRTGITRSLEWRENQLVALRTMMKLHAEDFYSALWTDLRRNRVDADWTDVKYITSAVDHSLAHLRRWAKPQPVSTPLFLAPSHIKVRFDPLGVSLIIGAWNLPVMLTLSPLIAAISGGNVAVIKPSELAPATANLLARLLPLYLEREAFSVVLGGAAETKALLNQRWDHIFFTGGSTVAKLVMTAAAARLTPVVLELGGKNPTIVHSSANLQVAARRIAQGRWMNAGQTCTAPDYVLVWREVAQDFLTHLKEETVNFYGDNPQESPDYGRIINLTHYDRLIALLASGSIYHGGSHDRKDRFIGPTVLVNVAHDSPVMQEEIFGPILPVLEVNQIEEVVNFINARESPLGLYVFAEDQLVVERILNATRSGNAAVNDCAIQPLIHEFPFGGVGNSGMGKYHGEWGFRAYTNARGVFYHSTQIDLGVRYPPYSQYRLLREAAMPS